jgi:hypothetical protein
MTSPGMHYVFLKGEPMHIILHSEYPIQIIFIDALPQLVWPHSKIDSYFELVLSISSEYGWYKIINPPSWTMLNENMNNIIDYVYKRKYILLSLPKEKDNLQDFILDLACRLRNLQLLELGKQ